VRRLDVEATHRGREVERRPGLDAALGEIRAALGPVTVLVNAAGKDSFRRFTDISFDEWRKIIDMLAFFEPTFNVDDYKWKLHDEPRLSIRDTKN